MQSCFVQVDGAQVHYWKAGVGPPLVMVHGLVADGRNWELNAPELGHHRTIYAVDMVNMGRSAYLPDAEARLPALADWLCRVYDALHLATADLVGSSHGGAVCLSFAVRHRARVRSLVLFGAANPFCQSPRLLIRFWSSPLGRLGARALPLLPRFVIDQAHQRAYADPRKAPDCMLDAYCEGLTQRSVTHLLRVIETWWEDMAELEQRLSEIVGLPALLVWGEQDFIVSVASGRRLAETLHARFLLMPHVGHLPFVEEVDAVNKELVTWLNSPVPQGSGGSHRSSPQEHQP